MRITINRHYMLFLVLFYTFIFNEPLTHIVPLFRYEDELLALMAIPIITYRVCKSKGLRDNTGCVLWLSGFVIMGMAGSVLYRYQSILRVAIPDLLLCLKFWMAIYASKTLFQGFDIPHFARKIYCHIRLIVWVFFILSIVNFAFGIFPIYEVRYDMNSNSLFYELPVTLVSVCSFMAIILIAIRGYTGSSFVYVLMISLMMVSTLRSKGFALAAVVCLMYLIASARRRKFSFKTMLLSIPIVLAASESQLRYYYLENADISARAQMLKTSFQVANDHFPFGAGFGTYGSYYSKDPYSPLYYKYGLNTLWGLSEDRNNFVCDSFWPMIMGQAGYFGVAFYVGALFMLARKILLLKKVSVFFFASGMMAIMQLIIDSLSGTAFVHPFAVPVALWIGVLLTLLPGEGNGQETDSRLN